MKEVTEVLEVEVEIRTSSENIKRMTNQKFDILCATNSDITSPNARQRHHRSMQNEDMVLSCKKNDSNIVDTNI